MSVMSVTCTLFRPPILWHKLKGKGDQFFEKFRYLGMEGLPQVFLIENSSISLEFLENKTEEITAGTYLISITEIVYSVQQIGTNAPLVFYYILVLIWGSDSIYL